MSSSSNKGSRTKNTFSEELTVYRSLAQKQYNDIVNCEKHADAVRETLIP